jgi:hypothetical protein
MTDSTIHHESARLPAWPVFPQTSNRRFIMLVKFPYSASRRLFARRPRRSKNGTPEERAAKAGDAKAPAKKPATVTELPRRTVAALERFIAATGGDAA